MGELDRYDYDLPRELIAQRPLATRTDARLLIADRRQQSIEHGYVRDIGDFLNAGDCLVLNDTRVIPARLVGRRARTGGRWSGLFLRTDAGGNWQIIGKTRGKLEPGETITLQDRDGREACPLELIAPLAGGFWVARPRSDLDAFALLEEIGRVPLPPYIRGGEMTDADQTNYQTVYADHPGAVAAPTAGLHFSPELLDELASRGVHIERVTLHVGLGTFRPISVASLDQHEMHSEWGNLEQLTADRLNACRAAGGRVIAVGTTSVRVLETSASDRTLRAWQGDTDLFIRPPYEFQAVDGLMTNFHLPRTSLLVLIHTFGGDTLMKAAYEAAIDERYRFYSYGDAMLIL